MPRIRVLVVDDSVVIRRMLSNVLADDSALEIAGAAANGHIALAKLDQVNPDVVILDVEMPEMNGLQTLAELRARRPRLPVIMFSTQTERGARITIEALTLGASDYITKPVSLGGVVLATQRVREELIPRIKALCRPAGGLSSSPARISTPPSAKSRVSAGPGPIEVLCIGVSTGGPNALAGLLPELPADFAVPILVVQHMPPLFTTFLADRLNARSRIRVREAAAGVRLEPGVAWLAPGDWHMELERSEGGVLIRTHQGPQENSCRPAADVLFRSVASIYGRRVLAVVLTGMGQDGLRGCELVKEAGGQIVVQDEATSVVWGMPGYVAQAGLADRVLPLDQIAGEIVRRAGRARSMRSAS
ncbi:MAG: chemotaxis response regulator protein-glutamate methylesterase [Gemmatimonadales bacterium]